MCSVVGKIYCFGAVGSVTLSMARKRADFVLFCLYKAFGSVARVMTRGLTKV